MKSKKIVTIIVALMLLLSLSSCGKSASDNELPTVIDFEDGNMGFVTEASMLKGGDPVELSIADINGSKVLKATNTAGKPETYVGIDVESILGANVANVKSIKIDIGVADETFNAISGYMYAYVGTANKETVLGSYSVYLETDNPKTLVFEMKEAFTSGAYNYIVISKEVNAATTPSDIFIDNITFLDADGNPIGIGITSEPNEMSPLNGSPIDRTRLAKGLIYDMGGTYGGDWGQTAIIPPEYFENVDGDVNIAVAIDFEPDKEYYLMAPIPANDWNKKLKEEEVIDLKVAEEAELFHLQKDGFIKIDDLTINAISFTITKETAKRYAEGGGMTFQIHGIKARKAVVSVGSSVVIMSGKYDGDGSYTSVMPAELFANADGSVTVEVDVNFEEGSSFSMAVVTSDDRDKVFAKSDFVEIGGDGKYHLDADGSIVFDDMETDTVSFTLTKDAAERIANGGGLTFKVSGVSAVSAIITK